MTHPHALLGPVRGTALYVAAIIGPGIMTLPALAAQQAGPASLITLGLLLLVSIPIAFTFVALDRRTKVGAAAGIPGYVALAFGQQTGNLVAAWFRFGVPIGVPALALIGGSYVSAAVGGDKLLTVVVAAAITLTATITTIVRRVGSGPLMLLLTGVLIILIIVTAITSSPHAHVENLTPFAPTGVRGVCGSALVLTWVLTGWEAATNFTRVLQNPRRNLPRVTVATLIIVAVLYAAVAVPEILVLGPHAGDTEAPLAAMLELSLGTTGALIAAVIGVTVALGNSLAYVGSLAELGPHPPAGRKDRFGNLLVPNLIIFSGLLLAAFTSIGAEELVSLCAASQIPVYVVGLAAALKLLPRSSRQWWYALTATTIVSILLIPAGPYLALPALITVVMLFGRKLLHRSPAARPTALLATRAERSTPAKLSATSTITDA
ncbi:APC family permease [Arthrobacter cheniae]|nr:APC family permease [Arthrobacter cheniae]